MVDGYGQISGEIHPTDVWRFSSLILMLLIAAGSGPSIAQSQTVALTFDDLPAAGTKDPTEAESFNRAILDSLAMHRAPAIGFVNEKKVLELGSKEVLEQWVRRGFDLGNHSFSHADLNNLTDEQFEVEVISGEASFALALAEANKTPRFLRFPYNHTGDTAAKHDSVAAFLKQRGYRVATCTIDNEDYLFNEAYLRMLARQDDKSAEKLRAEYLAYTAAEIDHYTGLHKHVWPGPSPRDVVSLESAQRRFDEPASGIFEAEHYRFVSLDTAQSDTAYDTPDTFTTSDGPMWGYRWAKERGVKVDGSLELEPAEWIAQYVTAAKK